MRRIATWLQAQQLPYTLFAWMKVCWIRLGRPYPSLVRSLRYCALGSLWPVKPLGCSHPFKRQKMISDGSVSYEVSDEGTAPVAVIIPCHNYGRFLAEAIGSVLRQTRRPAEILVVDDASEDDTQAIAARYADRGVRSYRGEWHDLASARNEGAQQTNAAFLIFLDADDRLPTTYIERCLAPMHDPAVAVVYGDMREFGNSALFHRMPAFDPNLLQRTNYISSHALLRRQPFDMVGGYRSLRNAHEDWDLYRRILRPPWIARKVHTAVEYRIHGKSYLDRVKRSPAWSYPHNAALLQEPVTLCTPFAGRWEILDAYLEGIRQLDVDRRLLHIHWLDTSGDEPFGERLRQELVHIPCQRASYTHAPLPPLWNHTPLSLIRNRVSNDGNAQYYYELAVVRAYNDMLRSCDTEFLFAIEDDIVPEASALRRMLLTFEADVVAVVAHYPCHLQGYSMVWGFDGTEEPRHFLKRRTGIEEVGGSGFGCSLFRVHALRQVPIHTRVHEHPPRWYDYNAFIHLRRHGRILCHWDIDVEHLRTERYAENLPSHQHPENVAIVAR